MRPFKFAVIAALSLWSTVAAAHPGRVPHRAVVGPRVVVVAPFAPLVVMHAGWRFAPHPGMVWVDGHYARHGRWVSGHWVPVAALR